MKIKNDSVLISKLIENFWNILDIEKMRWKSNSRNSADLERISEKDILDESHSISAHDKIIEQFSVSNSEPKNDNTEADASFHSG